MNCEIASLKDRRKLVDTLPPRGRVKEVRREWLVHEDGALAHRLQDEEFKQHLVGNKTRNVQIREDFPCAREEQTKEAEEASRLHHMWLKQLEEEDARVAAEMAVKLEREEEDRRVKREQRDTALARQLQEKEKSGRRRDERSYLESHTPRKENMHTDHPSGFITARALYVDDVAGCCVVDTAPGSRSPVYDPLYADTQLAPTAHSPAAQNHLVNSLRSCHLNEPGPSVDSRYRQSPSPPLMSEDDVRKLQEDKDAELARQLQELEEEAVDPLTRDRLLAIETQDKELARLLQEKERARLRRAKERARARAAAKRAEHEQMEPSQTSPPRPGPKPRYPDPDEIIEAPVQEPNGVGNIAMVIDPTYPRGAPRPDLVAESPVDAVAPPYMPIQGQKRSQMLEKKAKSKDGCKQQ